MPPSGSRRCGWSSASSRNDARVAALGELKTLLGAVKDAVAGLRNPPGLLGVNENVFERKQAFLTGGASGVAPAELVGVESREHGRRRAASRSRSSAWRPRTSSRPSRWAPPARPWRTPGTAAPPFAGTLELGLAGGAKATIAVERHAWTPRICGPRSTRPARRPVSSPTSSRCRPASSGWC